MVGIYLKIRFRDHGVLLERASLQGSTHTAPSLGVGSQTVDDCV